MTYETAAERDAREAKEERAAAKLKAERAAAREANKVPHDGEGKKENIGRPCVCSHGEQNHTGPSHGCAVCDCPGFAVDESKPHPDKDETEAAKKIAADAKAALTAEKADVRAARRAKERLAKLESKQKAVADAGAVLGKAQAELTAAGVEFDTKFDADYPPTQADLDYAAGVEAQRKAAALRG